MRSLPLAAALAVSLTATAAPAHDGKVTAPLKDGSGTTVGEVSLTAGPGGVLIRIEAARLTPGWHGAHLHDKGDCSKSDFTTAGGHVHGDGASVHGLLNPQRNDTGDLPNVYVGRDGALGAELWTKEVTLAGLRDADGSAVVIHASPDDHKTQPIGGAGARVACAVIR
jgi:Cu-Zn family superoxide dismutase